MNNTFVCARAVKAGWQGAGIDHQNACTQTTTEGSPIYLQQDKSTLGHRVQPNPGNLASTASSWRLLLSGLGVDLEREIEASQFAAGKPVDTRPFPKELERQGLLEFAPLKKPLHWFKLLKVCVAQHQGRNTECTDEEAVTVALARAAQDVCC